jgi:hypothetical protein
MASKIRLEIDIESHNEGITKTTDKLKELGFAGKSMNDVFKSGNLDAYNASLMQAYHTTALYKGEVAAASRYMTNLAKAQKASNTITSNGGTLKYTNPLTNESVYTNDQKEIYAQMLNDMKLVEAEAEKVRNAMANAFEGFDMTKFQASVDKDAEATRAFGTELEAIESKMKAVRAETEKQIRTGGDTTNIDSLKAQYQTLSDTRDGMLKSFDMDDFQTDMDKKSNAIKLFGTELQAIDSQMSSVRSAGMKLSEIGGDPEQIQKLSAQYKELSAEHDRLTKAANGTGMRIKNLIKNFVSAQLIVYALRSAIRLITTTIKESSAAAAEAEQVANKFITVFDNLQSASDSINSLVNDYGLAMSTSKDIMSTIGDMAIGLGASTDEAANFADETSKFIQDLRAFKDVGGDVIEMSQAFMSGAAGNTRNFRQWGSIVKEANVETILHAKGLDKLTGSALEWAKAQTRVEIVMSQQKNAIGATAREWDQYITVTNRYTEQTKQLKETIGTHVNSFFLPLKTALLEIIETYNKATIAKDNFEKNPTNPQNESLWDDDMKRTMQRSASKQYADYDMKTVPEFASFISEFGAPWEEAITILRPLVGISKELESEIRTYFTTKDKVDKEASEKDSEKEALRKYNENRASVMADMSDMFLGLGVGAYTGRDSSEFATPTYQSVVGGDTSSADNATKMGVLLEKYNDLQNIIGTEKDPFLLEEAKNNLTAVIASMEGLNEEIQKTSFTSQTESLDANIARLKKQNTLTEQYGEDGSDIVAILMEQYDAEQKALELKQDSLDAGVKESVAEQNRLALVALISSYYGMQVESAEKLAKVTKTTADQEARRAMYLADIDKLNSAKAEINALQNSNQAKRVNLGRSWDESSQESAKSDRAVALAGIGSSVEEMMSGFLSEEEAQIVAMGTYTSEMFLSADEAKAASEYKTQLEISAELDYIQSLKDARDSSLQSIESMWESLGDVGMIEGFKDIYDSIKAYSMTEAGGGLSEEDASMEAMGNVGMAILMEFLGHLDSVDEILSIVTESMDALAPIFDEFLEPIVELLAPIIELLDMLTPILTFLFPFLKMFAIGIVMVLTPIQQLAKVIEYAIGKITFWTSSDDIAWSEVQDVYTNNMEAIADIWAMEIDSRVEYVSELTDAQQGELDAYNEMFSEGLLSMAEWNSIIKKNIYGQTSDSSDIEAYANGGSFITNGEKLIKVGDNAGGRERVTITPLGGESNLAPSQSYSEASSGSMVSNTYQFGDIIVNGTDLSSAEIARALVAEIDKQERRGMSYAS